MRVDVHSAQEALAFVRAEDWDALSGNFYASHGWTKYVLKQYKPTTMIAIAMDKSELVGVLPLHQSRPTEIEPYNFNEWLAVDSSSIWLAGAYRGFENGIVATAIYGETYRLKVIAALFAGAAEFLRDHSGPERPLAMPFLPFGEAAVLTRALGNQSVPLLHSIDAKVDLPVVESWQSYLASQSRSYRYRVNRELRDFDSAGFAVSATDLAGGIADLPPLVSELQAQHGLNESVQDIAASLGLQEETVGEHALVMLSRSEDSECVAGALYYSFGDTLYGRMAGVSGGCGESAYFPTYMHAAVRHAVEHGYHHVHFGRKSLDAKCRRGAAPRLQWLVTANGKWSPDDRRQANEERLVAISGPKGRALRPSEEESAWLPDDHNERLCNA